MGVRQITPEAVYFSQLPPSTELLRPGPGCRPRFFYVQILLGPPSNICLRFSTPRHSHGMLCSLCMCVILHT